MEIDADVTDEELLGFHRSTTLNQLRDLLRDERMEEVYSDPECRRAVNTMTRRVGFLVTPTVPSVQDLVSAFEKWETERDPKELYAILQKCVKAGHGQPTIGAEIGKDVDILLAATERSLQEREETD
ncbi:hypothetical protein GCM10010464_04250 [Pseudonocardia yunnanensis]